MRSFNYTISEIYNAKGVYNVKYPTSTPTNSAKGGTALYIKENFDVFERTELKTQNSFLESTWVEIKNNNSKNIVCGCVYKHPKKLKSDLNEFNKYIDTTLKNLLMKKKGMYLRRF